MDFTSETIGGLKAGRELDALVAEQVMGYRRMLGPGYDYDGPCQRDEILVSPSMSDDVFNRWVWPPKGSIALTYFVPHFNTEIRDAQQVSDNMERRGLYWNHSTTGVTNCMQCVMYEVVNKMKTPSGPLAICKAALLVMDRSAGQA